MLTRQRLLAAALLASVAAAGLLAACGAQNKEGPRPAPKPEKCQSLDALAPALMDTLKGGQSEKLKRVIERERLFEDQPDGSPSPIITLLKVSMTTLRSMASDPPEPGAPAGQLCNEAKPPPSRDSNRMCEARRILEIFVHEGKGNDLLVLLDPLLARVLGYIAGAGLEPPHLEVATVFAASCSKAYCKTEDLLDTLTSMLSFLEPTVTDPKRPVRILGLLSDLLNDAEMESLRTALNSQMGEEQMVAFGNILLDNVMALPTDPATFTAKYHRDLEIKINDLLTGTLGLTRQKAPSLRALLDQIVGPHEVGDLDKPHVDAGAAPLMMEMLDPRRANPLLPPLQGELACLRKNDPNSAMLRMMHALFYKGDTLGLGKILDALVGLAELDERVSILTFVKRTVVMIRQDEAGTTAMRRLCAKALDTSTPATGGPSNAALMTTVAEDLFSGGAVGEIVCVADSLLYGCASGPQPACQPALSSP